MPLVVLNCDGTAVTDLTPLRGMPLKRLRCDVTCERDLEVMRGLTTLATINDKPAATYWKEADARRAEFDAWVRAVTVMKAEEQVAAVAKRLQQHNPGFDGKVTPKIENGVVTELTFISDNVTDLAPLKALAGLRALGGLRVLTCPGSAVGKGKLSDLSPLKTLPLTTLNCASTSVSDLTPVADLRLTVLHCSATPVADLTPLKGTPLATLACDRTKVVDLTPLQGLRLVQLRCDFRPERDAEVLRAIKTLQKINDQPAAEVLKGPDGKQ
jgi:hypothetical protein